MEITMTREEYHKKPGTKNTYTHFKTKTETIDRQQYNYFVDASPFFRRLGGSEYLERSYTKRGYLVTRVISKSPDRAIKKITHFKFN